MKFSSFLNSVAPINHTSTRTSHITPVRVAALVFSHTLPITTLLSELSFVDLVQLDLIDEKSKNVTRSLYSIAYVQID